MPFDHDFGCSFSLLSSLLKKEGRRKWEWNSKNRDKGHAFLLDQTKQMAHLIPFFKYDITWEKIDNQSTWDTIKKKEYLLFFIALS